jgi:hypothetical protein
MGEIRVSCIMPTGNRQHLIGLAIESFFNQTVTDTELIIVDDGVQPTVVPSNDRIRYFRIRRLNLGAKLNFACTQARADIICRWDDDDWYASDRISRQLDDLSKPGIEVTGFHGINYYDMSTGEIWSMTLSMPQPHAMGTSLFFKKSYWERNKFELLSIGEDTRFSNTASSQKVLSSFDGAPYVVAFKHGGNTSKFRAVNPRTNTEKVPPEFLKMFEAKIEASRNIVKPPEQVRHGAGPYAKDGVTVDWFARHRR